VYLFCNQQIKVLTKMSRLEKTNKILRLQKKMILQLLLYIFRRTVIDKLICFFIFYFIFRCMTIDKLIL